MKDELSVSVVSYGPGRALALKWRDPLSGKKIARSSGARDPRKAERLAGELEKELRAGATVIPSRITWDQFRDRFEADKLPMLAPGSAAAYRAALNHFERLVGVDRLAKCTTPTLTRFASLLAQEAEKPAEGEKPLTLATRAKTLRHVGSALSWAVRQGWLPKAPRVELPKAAKGSKLAKGRPLVLEEYERLIAVVPKVRPRDAEVWVRLIEGLWLSGLRLGEALALSWDDDAPLSVDFGGTFPRLRIEGRAQKSRRDEWVPIAPDFAQWLLAVPEADRVGKVFPVGVGLDPASKVIIKVGVAAGVVIDKAKGQYASAHDLRRSFCSRWSKRVMPATLQRLARHADISTTLKYYATASADEIAADLWNAFGNMPPGGNKSGNTAAKAGGMVVAADGRNVP